MTNLAPLLTTFFVTHLPRDRALSSRTIESYAHCFRLLLAFAADRCGKLPCSLAVENLDVPLVLDFLEALEVERENSTQTRNVRLAAIKAFFRFVQYREPACLQLCQQVRNIPAKRFEQTLIEHLEPEETGAILKAPDTSTRSGIRDQAMLYVTYACGLRVSELTGLRLDDLDLPGLATVHVMGKGRSERVLPLWEETRAVLRNWLAIRPDAGSHLFLNARGGPMTRHGFAHRLAIHVATATNVVPSIGNKRVTPHVLRHTIAMDTLAATGDIRKVSEWLGHRSMQSTDPYLRKDPRRKLDMLDAVRPVPITKGNFTGTTDKLMAMLNGLAAL